MMLVNGIRKTCCTVPFWNGVMHRTHRYRVPAGGSSRLSVADIRRSLSRAAELPLVQSSEIVQVGSEFYAEAGLERIQHFVPAERGAQQRPVSDDLRQPTRSASEPPPPQRNTPGAKKDPAAADSAALLSLVQIKQQRGGGAFDDKSAPVAFLLHGAISNGKVFHSNKASGLAPFLARRGFNVFVGELRGRGSGVPSLEQEARRTSE